MSRCPACSEVNPDRARFCLGCGQPLVEVQEPVPELRRIVTVVFADLAGSTALGESLDAEALRVVTGRFFDAMRTAVEAHGGSVEKFIGDAVVAVFGAPRVREDDALRAIRSAADMRAALRSLNCDLLRDLSVQLQVRIGVNTGEVVVGEDRAGGSMATGDALNVAARLQQNAEPNEILLGDSTYRLVRDFVQAEPVEALALKGKLTPVSAWRLQAVDPRTVSSRSVHIDAGFVGREPQLRLLEDAFHRAVGERSCQLVTVLGVAGMGKTRLAEEFLARRADAVVLQGRCLSYGQGATYWPLREAILAAAGLTGDESPHQMTVDLLDVLDGLTDAANVASRLLALVTLNRADSVPEDIPWAVRLFLEHLAQHRPVILVVDDLHWAEPGLLDVVEHVADWSRDAPIMIVGLARPEFYDERPTWGGGKLNATALLLSPLDEVAVGSLLNKNELPTRVIRRIVEAAGGNPLFAEQLVAMLVDEAFAYVEEGVVTWADADAGDDIAWALPPSVAALLTARIDRLTDEERQLLGCAAVVGAVFYVDAVASLTGSDSRRTGRLFEELIRKELLRPATSDLPGLMAYRFLHALVRDAAYDGVSKANRALWHEGLADWYAARGEGVVPEEIVGHHLASACEYRRQLGTATQHTRELADRAAARLLSAGRRLDTSDLVAASSLVQRAADLLESGDSRRFDCLLNLGSQLLELGQIDRAIRALSEVADSTDIRRSTLAKVLLCRANAMTGDSRVEDDKRVVAEAIRNFEEWRDDLGLAHAYTVQADLENIDGHLARSGELLARARVYAESAGDSAAAARARSLLCVLYLFGPMPAEQVIATLDKEIADSGNDPRVRAESEQCTCVMHAMCGRFDQARTIAAAAREHLAEVGHGLWLANLAQSTGHIEELIGDFDAACHEYERSIADLDRLGESAYLSTVAGEHARLLARMGDTEGSRTSLELARKHGSPDDVTTQSLITQTEALLAAAVGDSGAARAHLAIALRLEGDNEDVPDAAGEAQLVAADVTGSLGDIEAERAHLRAALEMFSLKGNVVRADQVTRRLSALSN